MGTPHVAVRTTVFATAVAAKGIDTGVQLGCGLLLLILPSAVVSGPANLLVTRDLIGDPQGRVATHLGSVTHDLTAGTNHGLMVTYLLLHAAVKLTIVALLALRVGIAFPLAVIVFGVLTGYEIVRVLATPSTTMIALTAFDAVTFGVIAFEWWRTRSARSPYPD
jgi:uncharacterized membrane protein